MSWVPCESGSTVRTAGSEGGVVQRDEEHEMGARITLEECGHPPFAITFGIHGVLTHTAFAATEIEAGDAYDAIKAEIEALLVLLPDADAEPEAKERFHEAILSLQSRY